MNATVKYPPVQPTVINLPESTQKARTRLIDSIKQSFAQAQKDESQDLQLRISNLSAYTGNTTFVATHSPFQIRYSGDITPPTDEIGYHNFLSRIQQDHLSLQDTSKVILPLTDKLNQSNLSAIDNYLLQSPYIFSMLLVKAFQDSSLTLDHNDKIRQLRASIDEQLINYRRDFYRYLTQEVLSAFSLQAANLESISTQAFQRLLPIDRNAAEGIRSIHATITSVGNWPVVVDNYLRGLGIDNTPQAVRSEMVNYMVNLGLPSPQDGATEKFDEFLGAAYVHSLKVDRGKEDPIKSIFTDGKISTWNFQVDYFNHLEQQGINRENILASGALDYIYELGDNMGIFRVTDALVLMWAQGRLELTQSAFAGAQSNGNRDGEAASKLYRYYKLRDNRLSFEERAMIYKQVLNKGQGQLLRGVMANKDFSRLWQQMMSEVVDFISKNERHYSYNNLVSRSSLYQSTRNLQHNLTYSMVGKPLNDVHELYAQLQECIEILSHPEIIDQMAGGGLKNMWTVVDKISRQELGSAPNISALRTAAVEGNKVFNWIGNFNESQVDNQAFMTFLNAAEAYIIAKGQSEEGGSMPDAFEEPDFEDRELEAVGAEGDEFDDWD